MNNYYRITGYCEKEDFCFIMDCYGMFEKLWQFSAYVLQKGMKVLEVSNSDNFIDVNTQLADKDTQHVLLRAVHKGKPEYLTQTIDGVTYKAVQVKDMIYIPERSITV